MASKCHLFSFGSNGSGQLGLGHRDDVSNPNICRIPNLQSGSCFALAAGGSHTLLISPSGSLYTTGENENNRGGRVQSAVNLDEFSGPQVLGSGQSNVFKFCSATWEASFLVTPDSKLYVLGSGSKGELGLGENTTSIATERTIEQFPPPGTTIMDISSCVAHTVVVLSNGEVYGWGNGRKGQVGEPVGICWSPRKIEGIGFKVARAVCGREFTYLVGHPGEGRHVVLGSDKWRVKSDAPETIPGWLDVGASWGSIFVLFPDGSLRSWGRNDHGQLGPIDLPLIREVAVGSEHVLARTQNNKVLTWGWGEHGNCGPTTDDAGDVKSSWNEIMAHNLHTEAQESVVKIAAGCATSWVLTQPQGTC